MSAATREDWSPLSYPERIQVFKRSDRSFRSQYEAEFSEWLRRNKVPHLFEPYVFTLANKSRYVPDFFIYNSVFVEVKGIWGSEGKKKFISVHEEFYGVPLIVMDLDFIRMLKRTEKVEVKK
jgi:hypothetical protein